MFDDVEDMLRLARMLPKTQIRPGLTYLEFEGIEALFEFRFPPDLRGFLAAGLPVGGGWPDWRSALTDPRSFEAKEVRRMLHWPLEGMLFDVSRNSFWDSQWGQRPTALHKAARIALNALRAAPALIPVYGHRYLPSEPCESGNPVFSVYQMDIIHYGPNLHKYLEIENRVEGKAPQHEPKTIRCWSAWAGRKPCG